MKTEYDNSRRGLYYFLFVVFALSLTVNIYGSFKGPRHIISFLPFFAGITAFIFQVFYDKKPLIHLYSKSYPYRRLKPYAWISAFILFEFILIWGLRTKQITLGGEDLTAVNILLLGAIVYYHLFVRMKISLRFLLLGMFVPLAAAGAALGLGSYFEILNFVVPSGNIGRTCFLNFIYWAMSAVFFQVVCEEPAFRGYVLQKVLHRGEIRAIVISALCYSLWRVMFTLFAGRGLEEIAVMFIGNLVTGAIFAILFIKGRNLLASIVCHGMVEGIWRSFFAATDNPGIGQYIEFAYAKAGVHLALLWYLCLLAGLVLLTFIPRKKLNINYSQQDF
jgi:membrane protease YdiL (CAAX protease family)